jgi:hypothetical protein
MLASTLIQIISGVLGDIIYTPHSMANVEVRIGVPPLPLKGLGYVFAYHNNPQSKMIMSLNGKGVFVGNRNKSGVVELGIMDATISTAELQILEMTGIPFPIVITDTSTAGTSTVVGSACRRVGTPQWRREASPSLQIYTLATPRLLVSGGIRLPVTD